MTTTPLFVELLVIGFGALLWVILAVSALLGYNPAHPDHGLFKLADPIVWLIPALTLAYVFGVITDRFADRFSETSDRKQRRTVYGEDRQAYFDDRRTLVLRGGDLWRDLEYGRSRMRICRGWALNSLLIAISLPLLVLRLNQWNLQSSLRALLVSVCFFALAAICAYCWRELNRKEYEKIQRQAPWVNAQCAQGE